MTDRPSRTDPTTGRAADSSRGRLGRRLQAACKDLLDRLVSRDLVTGGLFVLAFTGLVSVQDCGVAYPDLQVGEVVRSDIPVPFDVTILDQQATERRREEERVRVLPVYKIDPGARPRGRDLLSAVFTAGREVLGSLPEGERTARRPLGSEARRQLQAQLPLPVKDAALEFLAREGFGADLEATLQGVLERAQSGNVVDDPQPLTGKPALRKRDETGIEVRFDRLDEVVTLAAARERVRPALQEAVPSLDRRQAAALSDLLEVLVSPDLFYDAEETLRRREEAARQVPDLVSQLPRGKMIVRSGDQLTQEQLEVLQQIEAARGSRVDAPAALGSALLSLLLTFFLWRYLEYLKREDRSTENLFGMNLMVAQGMLWTCFALIQLGEFLAENLDRVPFNRATSYLYAIPVAAGAMLLALLARPRVAMVFTLFFGVVFGIMAGWDLRLATFALLSSFGGIYAVTQYKQRSAVLKAGLVVSGVNAVTIFALAAAEGRLGSPRMLLFDTACGLAGGVLVAITVSSALPVLEWMFSVLTDIRLLELSNLNNPLLRKLAVQAPGTYNHSVIVGTLAEAAAEAIAGNSLLCRVAAYYHDIGKMNKPEYFIENQMDAIGRHAKLSPTMSALIIASHVKDGLKLGREYSLPRPILDIIPQHHGTRLITYFFKKAKQREDREIQEVSESNFRYPGPKPQSKEAAIFMMADSVEAAARTVEDPTPAKFKDVIRKIVNAVILDDQLSDTHLTFRDLDRIQDAFLKTLSSIYHHRIEYPGFRFEERPGRDRLTLPS